MRLSACSRQYSLFSSFVFSCMLSSVVCCTTFSLCRMCFFLHAEVYSTHHGCQALWFVNQGCWWNLVGIWVFGALYWETGDRLVRAEECVETAHCTITGVLCIFHGETNWNNCNSLDHRYRAKRRQSKNLFHALNQEISMLTVELLQFRLQLDKQFRQRLLMRTHDFINHKVWSTSKALGTSQRSKENLRNSLGGSGRPRGL